MAAKKPKYSTIRELLFWSYANLAMAHSAVSKGSNKYGRIHFMIRAKLYKGLREGTMSIGTILDDQKFQFKQENTCCYCGRKADLTMDHLIPKKRSGPESADNVVWACRSCNSSKRDRDFLDWWANKHDCFPPLMLLRRYLKLALAIVDERGIGDSPMDLVQDLPFQVHSIPVAYPPPTECVFWVSPRD